MIGGNFNVLAIDIFKQVIGQQNFNKGAVVGLILLVPVVVAFVVDWIDAAARSRRCSPRAACRTRRGRRAWFDRALLAFCC